MLTGIAAQTGLSFCDPFASAKCLTEILAGASAAAGAGGVALAPVGAALAGSGAAGQAASAVTGAVANSAVTGLASAIQGALTTVVKDTATWWIDIPSPNLAADPVPQAIQHWLLPFTILVAVLGFAVAGMRMALTRKAAPLAELGSGLMTLIITTAVATSLPELLLKAGDAFSTFVLNASTGGHFTTRFEELVAGSFVASGGTVGPGLIIILGIFATLMAALQAILLLFRLGSVILLTGTLQLAAAGKMTPLTRGWLGRVSGWEFALLLYKPGAAMVYAGGFELFGSGKSTEDILLGFAVLGLSLIALPVLMRLFNWTSATLEQSGGGGFLGAVMGGAQAIGAIGAMRGFGASAAGQASAVSGALGTPVAGPAAGDPAGGGAAGGGRSPGGQGGGSPAGGGRPGAGSPPGGGAPPGGTSGGPRPGSAPGSAGSAASPGGSRSGAAAAPGGAAGGGAAAGSAAGGAAASGAAAAAGPAGMVVLGAQQAAAAGRNLAEGATTPPDQR